MDLVTNVVRGSESDRLLLLLHGYGADERDLGGLLGYLDPQAMADGFTEALAAIDDLLDAACEEHGMQRADAVVGGFSQGAGLALALALALGPTDRARPAGVLAMSPF